MLKFKKIDLYLLLKRRNGFFFDYKYHITSLISWKRWEEVSYRGIEGEIEMSIGDVYRTIGDRSPVQVDSRRRTEGGIETEACRGSVPAVSFCGVSTDRTQNITNVRLFEVKFSPSCSPSHAPTDFPSLCRRCDHLRFDIHRISHLWERKWKFGKIVFHNR